MSHLAITFPGFLRDDVSCFDLTRWSSSQLRPVWAGSEAAEMQSYYNRPSQPLCFSPLHEVLWGMMGRRFSPRSTVLSGCWYRCETQDWIIILTYLRPNKSHLLTSHPDLHFLSGIYEMLLCKPLFWTYKPINTTQYLKEYELYGKYEATVSSQLA